MKYTVSSWSRKVGTRDGVRKLVLTAQTEDESKELAELAREVEVRIGIREPEPKKRARSRAKEASE